MSGSLLNNLVLFGRVLRGAGLDAGPGRMVDVARSLEHVGIARKRDFYWALRAMLVNRRDEIPIFDDAFKLFWRKPPDDWTTLDLRALGERRRFVRRRGEKPAFGPSSTGSDDAGTEERERKPRFRASLTYSAREVVRQRDFSELTGEERDEVEALIRAVPWRVPRRRSRRLAPSKRGRIDPRASLRRSLSRGGEVLEWSRRERKTAPRPIVVLADISGSMQAYSRPLLLFMYGLSEALRRRVEAFLFGTRLTRVTHELRTGDVERALHEVAHAVADWSGGTRIGDAIERFNLLWSRRVPTQKAIVLIISDGWDRAEPELLRREMARLQRSSHRLIWLNPLLGSPTYEPATRGMQAALPFIDEFRPIHNLASLESLATLLADVPRGRPGRRQQHPWLTQRG